MAFNLNKSGDGKKKFNLSKSSDGFSQEEKPAKTDIKVVATTPAATDASKATKKAAAQSANPPQSNAERTAASAAPQQTAHAQNRDNTRPESASVLKPKNNSALWGRLFVIALLICGAIWYFTSDSGADSTSPASTAVQTSPGPQSEQPSQGTTEAASSSAETKPATHNSSTVANNSNQDNGKGNSQSNLIASTNEAASPKGISGAASKKEEKQSTSKTVAAVKATGAGAKQMPGTITTTTPHDVVSEMEKPNPTSRRDVKKVNDLALSKVEPAVPTVSKKNTQQASSGPASDQATITDTEFSPGSMFSNKVVAGFQLGSSVLEKISQKYVNGLIDYLLQNPSAKVLVNGFASSDGELALNKALSQKRANSFKNFLVGKKIAADRIEAIGRGIEDPIASNDTYEGRIKNRRVEITVLGKK